MAGIPFYVWVLYKKKANTAPSSGQADN